MKALDSRFTERSKATSGTTGISHANQIAADRPKDHSVVSKEAKPREVDSSSDSEEKNNATKSLTKRKAELDADLVEKRKKGRPRKDSRMMSVSLAVQSQVASTSEKDLTCMTSAISLRLPYPNHSESLPCRLVQTPQYTLK
ncbi:unnamed protein product [Ranitomeya imitator]|uniref:Uncharacterized protein n=1 Tax=Ranitomeya imitator TaxID=111125 RepID=A0ABN9MHL3_9NEOB|nr:unnamed protein product [Ranitomeya imitator]